MLLTWKFVLVISHCMVHYWVMSGIEFNLLMLMM